MNIRNISIRSRLTIGFGIIFLMLAFMGITALNDISEATEATENIYKHPLAVSNAVRDINANIIAIHRSMKDVALAENDVEMNKAKFLVDRYEKAAFEKFDIVFAFFLGDIKDVEKAHQSFTNWKEIREEVILLWTQGKKNEAIAITKGKGADHVEKVLNDVQVMIDFASFKGDQFYETTKQNETAAYNRMIFIITTILILSLLIIFSISRSIIIPIRGLNTTAQKIESGDLEAKNPTDARDELNGLAVSFNNMTLAIKTRNVILSGLAEISTSLHGLDNLSEFTSSLLNKYIELTKSQLAVFFIYDETSDTYSPIDAIGINKNEVVPFKKENASGTFHHAIRSKSVFIVNDIKQNNFLSFDTVAGKLIMKEIATIPIIDQNEVVALISCGVLNKYDVDSIEIFKQSQQIIGSSFSTLLANHKRTELAERLAKSNETLELQSNELKEQAQELIEQSNELKLTSDNLHEQNIELELQRREVVEANKLKSEFLSNMSHELRTPLNSINALSKVLIAQTSGKLDDDEHDYLKIIERNGKSLLTLINDILDLSKVEAGKMDMHIKPFSLNTSVLFSVESLQPLADEKRLKLTFNCDEKLNIESDESRLHQVLNNVIGNAIKFTEKGEVKINCTEKDGVISIIVKDTGIGIDKDVIPFIFNEFRQADGTTSRKYEGTGLGLAIAKKIVQALQGDITCESELGVGSVFTIAIPTKWNQHVRIEEDKLLKSDSKIGKFHDKTILVVDDDDGFIRDLSVNIKSEGYNVISAKTGKDAIELAIKHKPFAITLDIVMPTMDGWEVLQNLKSNIITSDIPVIIVSNSDETDTSIALGAVGYIQKPVEKTELIREIEKVNKLARKILIVDDNEVDILNLKDALKGEGYDIASLNSGKDCLDYLNAIIPDLLILDLMMPGMDGFDVIKDIRANERLSNLQIIIVTAKDLNDREKDYLNKRASSILAKGGAKVNLVSEVQSLLHNIESKEAIEPNDILSNTEKTILIIEDNESAIIQVQKELEKTGYKVLHALNGNDALRMMDDFIPDGIILDLMMPGMNGFEVLQNIRANENTKQIPILVLTAKTLTKNDLKRLEYNNINQLVQKGDVDIVELLNSVNRMVLKSTIVDKVKPEITKRHGRIRKKSNGKPDVLVIEDNPDNRTTIKAILGDGYNIYEAEDGELGLAMVKKIVPDLILLDISLPKLDGYGVIEAIREDSNVMHIPVIAVTAKAMKDDELEIIDSGCDAYISKPIDDEKLLSVINSYLKI